MKKIIKIILLSLVFVCCFQSIAKAQLDTGTAEIRQDGKRVGLIFVADRFEDELTTIEHWVLFPDYVFPGAQNQDVVTKIRVTKKQFIDLEDFLDNVPFGEGYRYQKVISIESKGLAPQ